MPLRFDHIKIMLLGLALCSCQGKDNKPIPVPSSIDLKRGEMVSCGPRDGELFGNVSFSASVPDSLRKDFNIAVALLHSFEYDESEKMFASVIDRSGECAMAWWGVAMSNFHSLWAPPSAVELQKGSAAIAMARAIRSKSKRESDYIEALAAFYDDADKVDHHSRVLRFERAMEKMYRAYPNDEEAAIFYTLALDAAADPRDKSFSNQRKAFSILEPIFAKEPFHPGIAHYIIHNCDYPDLAELALPAARKYASIAPASAHAQHMPSHIFTRLGLWDECIQSNLVSVSSAQCYAEKAKIPGHWDEELHGLDYLVYAYLQKGDDKKAREELEYVSAIKTVSPQNFKTAYAFAAIPARFLLEQHKWHEAAQLQIHPRDLPWDKFPWQKAILHFARSLGAARSNNLKQAHTDLDSLQALHQILVSQKDKGLEAAQVGVQITTVQAWIEFASDRKEKALALMKSAADSEDAMEKHPVTPGEVLPARELFADMLLALNKPAEALENFEMDLKNHRGRFNALVGAGTAALGVGNNGKASGYFNKLIQQSDPGCTRSEWRRARAFLGSPN